MTIEKEALQLNVHLAEHARLVGENHATFQRQQQQINIIVLLASGIVAILSPSLLGLQSSVAIKPEVFTLIPIPFLFLTCLHLRDDLKLHAIDEYIWLVLRKRIMDLTGLSEDQVWNWLQVADVIKFGNIVGYVYLGLSLLRYALPFYIYYTYPIRLCEIRGWTILSLAEVIATAIVFIGGLCMVLRSGRFIKGGEHALITKRLLNKSPVACQPFEKSEGES